jgi:hypothetical protein
MQTRGTRMRSKTRDGRQMRKEGRHFFTMYLSVMAPADSNGTGRRTEPSGKLLRTL